MINAFPQRIENRDGVLFFEDGTEVNLWGVNFQPNLYWEYKFRMEHLGLPMTPEAMKIMCDDGFNDVRRMDCNLIRCHLTPADFTDAGGNLVQNMWLDLLGYMVAKARENGVYVYLTFVNHMDFTLIKDSFVANSTREKWIFDAEVVAKTRNYIHQLINTVNPYTGIAYKDDPVVAVWGLINEPEYLSWQQMLGMPEQRARFEAWIKKHGHPFNDVYFSVYREEVVRGYIDGMCALLREEGARQPIIWNCNWPRMIDGRRDVFRAIARSQADAVSFCLYPGQDDVGMPFVEHPTDLSDRNYLPFLKYCFEDYDHLGWLRSEAFATKARVVYEFETMYNAESSYLYPAMAKLFRALGVQMAAMWTHTFNVYAPWQGGSHILNLRTTPKKAISFLVAGEVFRRLPCGFVFETLSETEDVFDGVALSWEYDISMVSIDGLFLHSGDVTWIPVALPKLPSKIVGYGNSPFVSYAGRGIYFLNIGEHEAELEIFPHVRFVRDWWRWHADGKPVVALDSDTVLPFALRLPGREEQTILVKPGRCRIPLRADKEALVG